jgi:hypothetical protein
MGAQGAAWLLEATCMDCRSQTFALRVNLVLKVGAANTVSNFSTDSRPNPTHTIAATSSHCTAQHKLLRKVRMTK